MPDQPAKEGPGRGILGRLADLAYYRSGALLLAAAVAVAAAVWAAGGVFDAVKPFGFQDPDSESARAEEGYEDATGIEPVPSILAIVRSSDPHRVASVERRLRALPAVARAETAPPPLARATDGRSTLVLGFLDAGVDDRADAGADVLAALGEEPDVELGGIAVASEQINQRTEHDLRRAELIALPILILLSLWVFRGLVAALLPIVVGALAIAASLAVMRVIAEIGDVDALAINLVTALGFGLTIDYCLFMISRYREELRRLGPGPEPLSRAMQTAGRTVAFSAVTIGCALAALLVFPQRYLYSMGIAGALVTAMAGLAVLTVLPAILARIGPRINSLAPARVQPRERGRGGWYRLAQFVTRRPVPIAAATTTLMIVAGLPFLRVELSQADAGTVPEGLSSRAVHDALQGEFRVDPGASAVVLVERQGAQRDRRFAAALKQLEAEPGVAGATVSPQRGLTRADLALSLGPNSDRAVELIERARGLEWGGATSVMGRTAELIDQRDSIARHLPVAIAIIVITTLALLLLMTRSLVLPLQALLMNLLTVSVALGVTVLLFQDGNLEGLLGYASDGSIDRSVPILLFAVVFGLSTDYGIFVITRIQEERRAGRSEREAIATGLEGTGRIVTAAALLLSVAIGAVTLSDLSYNKQLAIGAATGILVDATIVRGLLFPAVMSLCGRWTWWAPGWLR